MTEKGKLSGLVALTLATVVLALVAACGGSSEATPADNSGEPATTGAPEEPVPAATTGGTEDLVAAGEELFQRTASDLGCARCHAADARGDIGPNVVGKSASSIKQALASVPTMVEFTSLTNEEIEALAAYLESLPN